MSYLNHHQQFHTELVKADSYMTTGDSLNAMQCLTNAHEHALELNTDTMLDCLIELHKKSIKIQTQLLVDYTSLRNRRAKRIAEKALQEFKDEMNPEKYA